MDCIALLRLKLEFPSPFALSHHSVHSLLSPKYVTRAHLRLLCRVLALLPWMPVASLLPLFSSPPPLSIMYV